MRRETTIHHSVVRLHQHIAEMEYRAAILKQGRTTPASLRRMIATAKSSLDQIDGMLRMDNNTHENREAATLEDSG